MSKFPEGFLWVLESGEFSHSESGKNDRFWFKENSHT